MLARAVVSRPRLLLIDGALDGLSDIVLGEVLANLTRDGVPWTLLVATGRREVIEACNRAVSLESATVGEAYDHRATLT
jgi:putative ABC transport system ATP-binding protein